MSTKWREEIADVIDNCDNGHGLEPSDAREFCTLFLAACDAFDNNTKTLADARRQVVQVSRTMGYEIGKLKGELTELYAEIARRKLVAEFKNHQLAKLHSEVSRLADWVEDHRRYCEEQRAVELLRKANTLLGKSRAEICEHRPELMSAISEYLCEVTHV